MYRYGIEYEVGLMRGKQFLDFSNTTFKELQLIIDTFPSYSSDQGKLRVGDAGIKEKRWYLEGFERFDREGRVTDSPSKGIEIRTTPHTSIKGAADELTASYDMMAETLRSKDIAVAHIAYNPFGPAFTPDPPLQPWELTMRTTPEDQSAYLHMMTYGPDISISNSEWTPLQTVRIAKKLTYYSPYIVALSVNAPFKQGRLTGNKSERIMSRRGLRPGVLCFVPTQEEVLTGLRPSLTTVARMPLEVGRIEFKGLDCVPSLHFYAAMLALIKGVALSDELTESRDIPDDALLVRVAQSGLDDDDIYKTMQQVMAAAKKQLNTEEKAWLKPLEDILDSRRAYADALIDAYADNPDIIELLLRQDVA